MTPFELIRTLPFINLEGNFFSDQDVFAPGFVYSQYILRKTYSWHLCDAGLLDIIHLFALPMMVLIDFKEDLLLAMCYI